MIKLFNYLESIIKSCVVKYHIEDSDKQVNKYLGFLERRLTEDNPLIPKSPLGRFTPYHNLRVSELGLYSRLMGETIVIAGTKDKPRRMRIRKLKDLYVLKAVEIGASASGALSGEERAKKAYFHQTDEDLLSLYRSFLNNNQNYKKIWPTWTQSIDSLGIDRDVVKHFRQPISRITVRRTPSPYTNSHGGRRHGRKYDQERKDIA